MKKGFPQDGTEFFREHDRKVKRMALLRKRANFYHRARGLTSFKKELLDAVDSGWWTEFQWIGSYKSPAIEFSSQMAVDAIIDMLKKRGLIKHIK